jgi:uncharacterized protein (TIGR02246 family)
MSKDRHTLAWSGLLIAIAFGDATRFTTRQEIERYLSRLLAQLPKGTQVIATVTDVRFSGPDIAVLSSIPAAKR